MSKRAAERRRTDALLKQVQTLQSGMMHLLDENHDPGQRATTIRELMRQNSSLYWKGVFDVKQRALRGGVGGDHKKNLQQRCAFY